jgi:hypothetical protein
MYYFYWQSFFYFLLFIIFNFYLCVCMYYLCHLSTPSIHIYLPIIYLCIYLSSLSFLPSIPSSILSSSHPYLSFIYLFHSFIHPFLSITIYSIIPSIHPFLDLSLYHLSTPLIYPYLSIIYHLSTPSIHPSIQPASQSASHIYPSICLSIHPAHLVFFPALAVYKSPHWKSGASCRLPGQWSLVFNGRRWRANSFWQSTLYDLLAGFFVLWPKWTFRDFPNPMLVLVAAIGIAALAAASQLSVSWELLLLESADPSRTPLLWLVRHSLCLISDTVPMPCTCVGSIFVF